MKSYLSLVPISVKVRRRQNRMTLLCIVFAVFLVTAVFSMADMAVRMETNRAIDKNGNWHIMLNGVEEDIAQAIGAQKNVVRTMWYNQLNGSLNEGYYCNGQSAVLCMMEESVADIYENRTEGRFPESSQEIMLSDHAKKVFGTALGDTVTVDTPTGAVTYTVCGFHNIEQADAAKYDAALIIMNREAFYEFCEREGVTPPPASYYIRLKEHLNYRRAIEEIRTQYHLTEEQLAENLNLLMAMGFGDNSYIVGLYFVALVLAVLILMAGIFMIAGSLNSNVAERTQFFGMLRCIGAGKGQIIRLVRLESLQWCKIAVPVGCAMGVIATWGLCAILRFYVSSEFNPLPLFGVSVIGIVSGALVGIMTVLIAAQAPAKRAACVSPMAAVSGSVRGLEGTHRVGKLRFLRIETALGVHHALSAKKNLALMTGSFALSIVLLLSFSVLVNWVYYALNPLKPYAPDVSVASADRSCSIASALVGHIREQKYVEQVFARMYQNIPATYEGRQASIDLITDEEYLSAWAKKELIEGSADAVLQNVNQVLVVADQSNTLAVGDELELAQGTLKVVGILGDSPFGSDNTPSVICSEETFTGLTGIEEYAVVDIRLGGAATDSDVNAIRELAGEGYVFSDRRVSNREVANVYLGFSACVYGFLAVIAIITVLNIVNSMSMSVAAKIRQYGAMRAVGMDERQVVKMIAAEGVTYAVSGLAAGCVIGIPIHKYLFSTMITSYFGNLWTAPLRETVLIVLLISLSVLAAVYAPAKRIRNLAVTEAINEL